MRVREVVWADIVAAAKARDPQLADLVVRYMDSGDPPEDRGEEADPAETVVALPDGAWTLRRLRQAVNPGQLAHKSAEEQQAARNAAWSALEAAAHPPPRLKLGQLMVELYEAGDEPGLASLRDILRRARIGWGFWRGFKRIFKLAEAQHDAPMLGLLAWRLDTFAQSKMASGEVGRGTLIYMRRRAWRFLRQLGTAVPEAYPEFAVEVLRHYEPGTNFWGTWVASHIWSHEMMWGTSGSSGPSEKMKDWAFPDAWKARKEPLLRLLEHAEADEVCAFAITGLEKAFADALRDVEPAWLLRLGKKSLPSVHDFVARLLQANPKFHPSKLAGLGLEPLMLAFLGSPSSTARTLALEYVRGQSAQVPVERLVQLAELGHSDGAKFALERLEKISPKDIGLPMLVRLVLARATAQMASKAIRDGFTVDALGEAEFVTLMVEGRDGERFVDGWFSEAKRKPPVSHLQALLVDDRLASNSTRLNYRERRVLSRIGERKASEIGVGWIQDTLLDRKFTSEVSTWLSRGKLKGDDVDVAWFQGLIAKPKLRSTALAVLGEPTWVGPAKLGVPWLLGLLRHADAALRTFARRHLLEHFTPDQLGGGGCWALLGEAQPEAVREFAATYLRLHHPDIGPTQSEARDLGIEPRLIPADYAQATVVPLTDDPRPDVRRFAAELIDAEIRRWDDATLLYRLAESPFSETRNAAGSGLLLLGDDELPPERMLPVAWLSVDAVFSLAESPYKSTREVALTLVRRHYDRLGGADRLAWLMESPDREVRLFAVRLLWEKHRPRGLSPVATRTAAPTAQQAFDTSEALREFLRTVLFGLPPGRMERRAPTNGVAPDRSLPASVAKQRLVGVLRDFALEDAGFAAAVLPILEAFAHSSARGERDACLSALVALRAAHPQLGVALASQSIEVREPRRRRFAQSVEGGRA
ncbi:MAG: hypothetical protein ACRBN8_11010 [Nannocystales bacterium]